jgi:Tfp pilus assembly protein PilX
MVKHFFSKQKTSTSQDGVTLLISIMMLSGILVISVTVGYFAIQELRASRAYVLSEPAVAAAQSGAEKGIWYIKRTSEVLNCANPNSTTLSNNTSVEICKTYQNVTVQLQANTDYVFYLYNPNNINGDPDMSDFPINYLDVTHKSGAYLISVDIIRITGESVRTASVNPESSTRLDGLYPGGGQEARMKVTLRSAAKATVELNTNQGMPDFPVIDSSGCSGVSGGNCSSSTEAYKRKINVTVPQ